MTAIYDAAATTAALAAKVTRPTGPGILNRPAGGATVDYAARRAETMAFETLESLGLIRRAPFAPPALTNLKHWWRASSLTASSDGASVAAWSDSVAGRSLSQATGSKQPTIRKIDREFNDRPSVVFDGVNDFLQGTFGATYAQPYTLVFVLAFGHPDSSGGIGTRTAVAGEAGGIGPFSLSNFGGGWTVYAGANLVPATNPNEIAHVLVVESNGASSVIRLDGAQISTGDAGANSLSGLTLGAQFNDTEWAKVAIAEVMVYNAALSAAETALVEDWAMARIRRAQTALEQPYRLVSVTPADSMPATVMLPASYDGSPTPLILWHHGVTGTENDPTGATTLPLAKQLLAAGFIVACSRASSDNWGNQASLNNNVALYTYMTANYNISGVMGFSISMGGLDGLLIVGGNLIPYSAWAGVDAVASLSAMFGANAGTYAASIRAAYGIAADGSNYAALTAGYDPAILASFANFKIPMRWYHGATDATVVKATNADVMSANVAALAPEERVVTLYGGHVHSTHFADTASDIRQFFERCL